MLDATSISSKTFAVCTVILYFKFLVTARTQAHATFAAGGRTPEDNMLGKLAKKEGPDQNYGLMIDIEPAKETEEARQKRKAALENDQRWKRIVANDLESIPLALLVFGAGLVVESHETVQAVAMIVYTLARLVHTVVYAKGLQPWRSIVWIIGVLGIIVAAVNIIVSVLAK